MLLLSILELPIVLFLYIVVVEIFEPSTFWGWVGTLTVFAVLWLMLYKATSKLGYRIKALFWPKIRRPALERLGQELCKAIQVAVRQDDLALISDLFAAGALTPISTLSAAEGQALREAWFPPDDRVEVNAQLDEARIKLTSVPRKMGNPTVCVTFTYRYKGKTDNVTGVAFEFQGLPEAEPQPVRAKG